MEETEDTQMSKTLLLIFTLKQQSVAALRKIVDCWVKQLWVGRHPKAPVFNDIWILKTFQALVCLETSAYLFGLQRLFHASVFTTPYLFLLFFRLFLAANQRVLFFLFVLILVSSLDMRIFFFLFIFMLLYVFRYFMLAITWGIFL